EDALAWRSRHDPMLRQRVLGVYRRELGDLDLDELAAAAREVTADGEPRSMPEIGRALAARWPDTGPRPLGEVAVSVVPVVQVPPRGVLSASGGARNVPMAGWHGREGDQSSPISTDH